MECHDTAGDTDLKSRNAALETEVRMLREKGDLIERPAPLLQLLGCTFVAIHRYFTSYMMHYTISSGTQHFPWALGR